MDIHRLITASTTVRCALLAAMTLVGTTDVLLAQDVLVLQDGRRIRGATITGMTSSTISYERAGAKFDLPANSLAEVQWGNAPESFLVGRAAINNGRFQEAATAFDEAAQAAANAPLKTEAAFQAAVALARAAGTNQQKASEAADRLNAWIATNPDGYRLPDAMLALGNAQLAAGDAAKAGATFQKLSSEAISRGWAAVWGPRAKFAHARALLAQGNLNEARAAFTSAQSSARAASGGEDPDPEMLALEAQASVGIGETTIKEGRLDEALNYFRDLARTATNEAVKAAARAGAGEALYLKAKGSGDVNALREAQIALAEANLLDTTAGEATAKALYYSGLVLLELGPEHEASNFRERALEYFQTVVKHYPKTSWATRAAEAGRN